MKSKDEVIMTIGKYLLSDPGRGNDRMVITWTETIEPFYVLKYPVT